MKTVLVCDDDDAILESLRIYLSAEGYKVLTASNGIEALAQVQDNEIHCVVLDIMMPGLNGIKELQTIRTERSGIPVMMLTAKTEIEDRVAGLEAGADDYLPKPFSTREFIARVRALVRRNDSYADSILLFGNIRLDCNRFELSSEKGSVRLNNKEYQVMELFLKHPHYVFSSNHIMDKVWGQDSEAGMDAVWTYIGFVRKKLKVLGANVEIKTVRGAGYSLEERKC